ncbi:hypothetical protein D3C81_1669700 [compost metagenome]
MAKGVVLIANSAGFKSVPLFATSVSNSARTAAASLSSSWLPAVSSIVTEPPPSITSALGPSSSKLMSSPMPTLSVLVSPSPSVTVTTALIRPVRSIRSSWAAAVLPAVGCVSETYCATATLPSCSRAIANAAGSATVTTPLATS